MYFDTLIRCVQAIINQLERKTIQPSHLEGAST